MITRFESKATESNNITYGYVVNSIEQYAIRTRWNAVSFFIGLLGVIDNDMYYFIEKAYHDGFLVG